MDKNQPPPYSPHPGPPPPGFVPSHPHPQPGPQGKNYKFVQQYDMAELLIKK